MGYRYAYTRVSTDKQDYTGQVQLCLDRGVPNRNVFVDPFSTGKNMERTAFKQLNAVLREGDTVVCTSIWRIGRCDEAVEWLIHLYTKRGVNFEVADCDWLGPLKSDMDPAIRNGILWFMGYMGKQYLRGVSFSTKNGMKALALTQGMKPGRMPIAPETAALIRDYYAKGWSKARICKVLNVGRTTVFKYTTDPDYNPLPCRKADTTLARLASNGKQNGKDTVLVHRDRRKSRVRRNGAYIRENGLEHVEPLPSVEYAF